MLSLVVEFVVQAAIIVVAGLFLTRSADAVGRLTGMGGSLTGLVLLAAATSLPELAVNISAVRIPAPDLAIGAVLGSSLLNLLILAVIDMGRHAGGRLFTPMVASHALSATASIVLTAIVLLFIVLPNTLMWQGIGLGTVMVTVCYCLFLRLIYFDQLYAGGQTSDPSTDTAGGVSLRIAVLKYLLSTAVIFVTAHFLAQTADTLAEQSGLGASFIGTTLVALATSLPEIVTTLAAVRMGAFEMAVGNIFGSNCFNMAILLPVDAFYRPSSLLEAVQPSHAVTAAAVIIITGTAMAGLLYQPAKKHRFIEPSAALIVVLVLAALGLVYWLGRLET